MAMQPREASIGRFVDPYQGGSYISTLGAP